MQRRKKHGLEASLLTAYDKEGRRQQCVFGNSPYPAHIYHPH
jgi:hypothetical protein